MTVDQELYAPRYRWWGKTPVARGSATLDEVTEAATLIRPRARHRT